MLIGFDWSNEYGHKTTTINDAFFWNISSIVLALMNFELFDIVSVIARIDRTADHHFDFLADSGDITIVFEKAQLLTDESNDLPYSFVTGKSCHHQWLMNYAIMSGGDASIWIMSHVCSL
jgi:hypothetical protein